MKFRNIEEISIDESKKIFGGIGYSDDCKCECSCDCGCDCECEKSEKEDEIAGKAAVYATTLKYGPTYVGGKAGDATGKRAENTMT